MTDETREQEQKERLPIAPPLKVMDYRTISKGYGWWQAVVLTESWGKRTINLYLWQEKDHGWRRKQKFTIHDKEKWHSISQSVGVFLNKIN